MKFPGFALPLAALLAVVSLSGRDAHAQFTGPSEVGSPVSVAQALEARIGSEFSLTGQIVAHQGEDYYTFRDTTGAMRVEIEPEIWQGRKVGPESTVRLRGEVDHNPISGRYFWVESLVVIE